MQQSNKPQIKIPLTVLDRSMEFFCICMLIFVWGYVVFSFKQLPNSIPTHFNFWGSVDGYGDKSSIFVLPFVVSFLYLLLTIVGQFPNLHHYPVKVTVQNALPLYTASSRLLRYIKFIVLLIFAIILMKIVHSSTQKSTALSAWFLPTFTLGLIIPSAWFIAKSWKFKATTEKLN